MFIAPLQTGRAGGQAEPAKPGSLGGQGAGRVFAHGPRQPEPANPRPLCRKGRAAQLARLLLLLLAGACAGCSSLLSNVVEGLAADLSAAILENPDVDLVRDGAPAYLILIDGLLISNSFTVRGFPPCGPNSPMRPPEYTRNPKRHKPNQELAHPSGENRGAHLLERN